MELRQLDIFEPIHDFAFPASVWKCEFEARVGSEVLGTSMLPVCDQRVSAWVLKDVISTAHAWDILRLYFTKKYYSSHVSSVEGTQDFTDACRRLHDQHGWTFFLRELWNKPDWSAHDFYDAAKDDDGDTIDLADPFIEIELTKPVANISVQHPELSVLFSFAGCKVGLVTIPVVDALVTAQQIRTLVTTSGGFELCRIVVREAIVGRVVNKDLSLAGVCSEVNFKKSHYAATPNTLVLGRRSGMPGLNVNYRYVLPSANAHELMMMAEASQEAIVQYPSGDFPDGVIYAPDVISGLDGYNEPPLNMVPGSQREPDLFDRHHFESLFSGKPDPWKYTHPYEQTKYQQTLSLLADKKINSALELACAEGHFTEQLSEQVDQLTAADISEVALKRAAERCRNLDNIDFVHLDLFNDEISGRYDLIVCSEVLYFVKDENVLKEVCDRMIGALNDEGYFLTAHAHLIIDEPEKPGYDWRLPFGAKTITETLLDIPGCMLVKEIKTPLYRVQLFQKLDSKLRTTPPKLQSVTIEQPTEVPDRVKDTVRWNGGEPSPMARTGLSTMHVPILMYHRISGKSTGEMSRYDVSPASFEQQMKYLRDGGYQCITWHQWARARNLRQPLPGRAVMITFDDGYSDFYTEAWPVLRKYGLTATVFIVSDLVGHESKWDAQTGHSSPLMSWPQILELQKYGVTFGSHTASHPRLSLLSPDRVVSEAARSRLVLEQKLGRKIDVFAYPYGDFDGSVAHLVAGCGYNISVSTQPRKAAFNDNIFSVPRLEITGDDTFEDFVLKIGG